MGFAFPKRLVLSGWSLTLLGVIFFLPLLGGVHLFDWDEINFAECAREMILTGNYGQVQIDFQPFWEKPPLFIWMQALSMQLFGVGAYAARLPNALAGLLTMALLYRIGNRLHGKPFGWLWGLAYLGSLLPHLYFKSGIIDPWFNLFIFSGLYVFIEGVWQQSKKFFLASGIILGLAVLTKGPVGLLLPGLVMIAYWIRMRFRWYVRPVDFVIVGFSALGVTGLWFGLDILQHGTWFVEQFITYQIRLLSTPDAGHGGFPGYHVVVLLLGCFPASIFAIPALWRSQLEGEKERMFRWWMVALFWVVLILFSIVQSKIVHYSSMAYFPLTYLAATTLFRQISANKSLNSGIHWGITGMGLLIAAAALTFAWAGQHLDLVTPLFAKDPFALANLDADVHWNAWTFLPGALLLGLVLWWVATKKRLFSTGRATLLFLGTALFLQMGLIFFVARVEGYSQRAAIEFYQSLQGKECYVKTVGFKSYAHLFYSQKQPGGAPEQGDLEWFATGPIDRDVFVVTKIHKAKRMEQYPELKEVGRKNGFVFFERQKPE
ncbi:MAG: glycosyltransferase family 39 protein [Saprospirales bacterium]|nr:glycosyltransferase family 39 protein [Saprospirales bacterium]